VAFFCADEKGVCLEGGKGSKSSLGICRLGESRKSRGHIYSKGKDKKGITGEKRPWIFGSQQRESRGVRRKMEVANSVFHRKVSKRRKKKSREQKRGMKVCSNNPSASIMGKMIKCLRSDG